MPAPGGRPGTRSCSDEPGIAYVYLVYGMHDCLNVVTGPANSASALLIRAVAPTEGVDVMRADRLAWFGAHRRTIEPAAFAREAERLERLSDLRLASGPGLVAAAFGIDRSATGTDLLDPASPLRLEGPSGTVAADAIETGPGSASPTRACRGPSCRGGSPSPATPRSPARPSAR